MESEHLGDELVQHASSLRRLARGLLQDEHLAEDAVQDAMRVAITAPPLRGEALPAWLRTVVRRCALDLGRGERRRRERERAVSRASSTEAETLEQAELLQHLLKAVLALDEPYRSTVWQRYFADQSPRAIAARENVPIKTIKTRLWRALAQLRERLDRRCGDRGVWLSVLIPVIAKKPSTLAGAVLMSSKTKLALVVALSVVVAVSWITWSMETATNVGLSRPTEVPSPVVHPETSERPSEPALERSRAALSEGAATNGSDAPVAPSPAVAGVPLGGVVLDVEARRVPGIQLSCNAKPFEPPVFADADGRFTAARAPGLATLAVYDAEYVAVLAPTLYDLDVPHPELTIVVAPSAVLSGLVVDESGQPIERAEVVVSLGVDVRPRIPRVLDRCVGVNFSTMTTDDGAFALGSVPAIETSRLRLAARGFRTLEMPVGEARALSRFVMQRIVVGDTLEGVVVDEQDRPIPDAVVSLPSWSVVTQPDGTFRVELWKAEDLPEGTLPDLVAVASGRLPGKITALSPDWRSRSAWPRDLRFRLGGAAERIVGHVRHSDGQPVLDVQVTFVPPEPEQITQTLFDSPLTRLAESIAAVDETPESDAGGFETPPVVPGSYRLRVFDPHTLAILITDPIRTGLPPVELRMPERGLWPALSGTVVDRSGAPVAGADWIVEREDPMLANGSVLQGAWQQATAEGRIEGPPLSRDVTTLCVKAAGMANWVRFPIADLVGKDFRVVVPVGCQARVEVGATWGEIDQVGFLDLAGQRSSVVFTHGNFAFGSTTIAITEGRSQTFVALDDCVELLLFRSGALVGKVPVVLRPGAMNVLSP